MVIAIIAILAGLLLPALARAKERARATLCLNNLKQLHLGWNLYSLEFDRLAPNDDYGDTKAINSWAGNVMTYEVQAQFPPITDSTNTKVMLERTHGRIGPYVGSVAPYRCPSDQSYAILGGQRRARVRSYSMNMFIGDSTRGPDYAYNYYHRMDDFRRPGPTETFVFADEHEDSVNDGYFLVGTTGAQAFGWNDIPASRHNRGAQWVFADGHAERHRWQDVRTLLPVTRVRQFGVQQPANPDVRWLHAHASAPTK